MLIYLVTSLTKKDNRTHLDGVYTNSIAAIQHCRFHAKKYHLKQTSDLIWEDEDVLVKMLMESAEGDFEGFEEDV